MSTPTIYSFHALTRVYVGAGMADPDPLDPNGFLMPAYSTLVEPPQAPEGQVAVFDPTAGAWSLASAELFEPPEEEQEPPLTLEQVKFMAQANIDRHFEMLYFETVPNAAIANEYASAYESAKAWLASLNGALPLVAPHRVAALAEQMAAAAQAPVSNEQAAQYVVAKWQDAQRALDERGAARLRAKAAIRAAGDQAAVFAAEAAGKQAMDSVAYQI